MRKEGKVKWESCEVLKARTFRIYADADGFAEGSGRERWGVGGMSEGGEGGEEARQGAEEGARGQGRGEKGR